MPVETMFTRRCRCGETSRNFGQYADCPACHRKDGFVFFKTEPLSWSLDRAMTRLRADGQTGGKTP